MRRLALIASVAAAACSSAPQAPCDGGACGVEAVAASAAYRDEDPRRGTSGGAVRVGRAADESSVDEYVALWTDAQGQRVGVAARGAKTGADLTLAVATGPVPSGATSVLVVTARGGKEASRGVAAGAADNYARLVDVGASSPAATAPSVVAGASKLLVVATAAADQERALLFSCASDVASACTSTTINGPPQCGRTPAGVVDPDGNRLLIVAAHGGVSNHATLLGCATDGTDCNLADLAAGQGADSGLHPRPIVDANASKLLVVARNDAAGAKPSLYRCALDGTACVARDVSGGQPGMPADVAARPWAALGAGGLFVAWPTAAGVALSRCNADGTACAAIDLAQKAALASPSSPSVAVDEAGARVLVAVESAGKTRLARCAIDLSTCDAVDPTAGASFGAPQLALDGAGGALWIAGTTASSATLVRCARDGTACAAIDLGPSSPQSRASLALDGARAWVAFDDSAPTHVVLWSLGLW